MDPIERRIRNAVNPYSTAFAAWWCHLRLRRRGIARPANRPRPSAAVLADRRAAVDALLAKQARGTTDGGTTDGGNAAG
jgi:hypothetical protein